MSNTKKNLLRCFSVILAVFSVAFGVTWNKTGYCLGDEILTAIGLTPWSQGTQGTHYTALYALAMLFAALFLFASTTKNRQRTMRYLWVALAVIIVLLRLFSI